MTITATFTALDNGLYNNKITTRINGKITAMIEGDIRVRINEIFNQVRSKVRTEITLLKLVSSQVSTGNAILSMDTKNEVSKREVRTQVRTESGLFTPVSKCEVSNKVSIENEHFTVVAKKEVAALVATEKAIYNHAYHNRKSLLLASIKLIFGAVRAREGNSCHQNNDNVTKTVTLFIIETVTTLYQISKTFTKIGKANNDFKDTLGREFSDTLESEFSDILGGSNKIIFGPHKKGDYLAELANFSRQVAITQAEKLVFSFFAIASICSISSWGKRIFFNCDLLFLLPVTIIQPLILKVLRLTNSNKKRLTCLHTKLYIGIYTPNDYFRSYKTIPRSVPPLSRNLTQPLYEVMIMANCYDSAHLRAEQSKLFKFYDTSTAHIVQSIATTEQQARQQLAPQSLIFVARIPTIKLMARA